MHHVYRYHGTKIGFGIEHVQKFMLFPRQIKPESNSWCQLYKYITLKKERSIAEPFFWFYCWVKGRTHRKGSVSNEGFVQNQRNHSWFPTKKKGLQKTDGTILIQRFRTKPLFQLSGNGSARNLSYKTYIIVLQKWFDTKPKEGFELIPKERSFFGFVKNLCFRV